MFCLRRLAAVLGMGIIVLAGAGLFTGRGDGQPLMKKPVSPTPPVVPGGGTASGLSSVKITEDSRFRRVINVGRDCIKDKDFKQAVEAGRAAFESGLAEELEAASATSPLTGFLN